MWKIIQLYLGYFTKYRKKKTDNSRGLLSRLNVHIEKLKSAQLQEVKEANGWKF